MATIPGHIRDEVVIIGCHRDGGFHLADCGLYAHLITAWVMGAADPISGTVSLHEVIRGFGSLLRTGWKPLRTGSPSLL
jgi:N-acetylated-alpha-linked acidic dipeptidase